jgi:hypothetical protein
MPKNVPSQKNYKSKIKAMDTKLLKGIERKTGTEFGIIFLQKQLEFNIC